MPDIDQDQNQNQQLTGDDLSELHGFALRMQAAGDPRAQKLWNFIAEQSGGGDGSSSGVRMLPASAQPAAVGEAPAENGVTGPAMRPETAQFLNDLSGIGTGAFLDMRQADTPEYANWRDDNFAPDSSGNYVSQEGQAYTDGDLKQIHGVLSRQAGNPLVSSLFAGPKTPVADYMTWRNQNFDGTPGGVWEDDNGTLYTEQSLQKMFGDKAAVQLKQVDQSSSLATDAVAEDGQQEQLLAQNADGRQAGQQPGQQQQPRQPAGQPAGPQQPQQRDRLTQAEREAVAGVAYSETTRGTVAEHEAIASVIVNRAESGDRQYVNRGQPVNVDNVIHAAPGGARQFQGVGHRDERNFARTHDEGSQNARTAAANVARSGPTNHATAFLVTGGQEPTAREESNLGNVHRTGRVGNVFLYEPGPAPEAPALPRRVPQPQRPQSQAPLSSPRTPQQLPDNEE